MAFDIGGTFNKTQFARFLAFANGQTSVIQDRIGHLVAEKARVGSLVVAFSNGVPSGYSGDPASSYIGKLVSVYEVLGGQVEFDLQVRGKATSPVFLVRSDEGHAPLTMSSGDIVGKGGLSDGPSAEIVRAMKDWMRDTLRYRREAVERQILKMIDYSDQLNDEITLLQSILGDATVSGSLANLSASVDQLISDHTYQAIYDDGGNDPYGRQTHAQFAPYPAGDTRTGVDYIQRGPDGIQTPNDEGNPT